MFGKTKTDQSILIGEGDPSPVLIVKPIYYKDQCVIRIENIESIINNNYGKTIKFGFKKGDQTWEFDTEEEGKKVYKTIRDKYCLDLGSRIS